MKKMLLTFKPSVYKNIYAGVKIFEYRRNFQMNLLWLIWRLVNLLEPSQE